MLAVDWGREALLVLFSLVLCAAVGVEEPESSLDVVDHLGKRAVLGSAVGREQDLVLYRQLIADDVAAGLVQDGKDPGRASRAVALVAGSVLGKHGRINVVGLVEALLELLLVAALFDDL